MKKIISLMAAVLLSLGLTACGNNEGQATNGNTQQVKNESSQNTDTANKTESSQVSEAADKKDAADNAAANESASDTPKAEDGDTPSENEGSTAEHSSVLVVYFSATGTTAAVAEKIAGITGADMYEIKAAQEYTDADLDWNDSGSRSTKEQNDSSARPEIGSDALSLDGYSTI